MARALRSLGDLIVPLCAAVLLLGAVACEPAGEGDLDLAVYGLSQCSSDGAIGTPSSVRLVVRGPVPYETETGESGVRVEELKSKTGKWGTSVSVGGIPEGEDREVTVLAFERGNPVPVAFARANNVSIRRGESTQVEAILTRFAGQSCPSVPAEFGHRVFPATVELGDGRVMVSGGFTTVEGSGADMALAGADTGIYIYDPLAGDLTKVGDMARGRGGHTAVYLPRHDRVVFFGGAPRLGYQPDGGGFPFVFTKADIAYEDGSGNELPSDQKVPYDDYEIYDLASGDMLDTGCPQTTDACLACCETDGRVKDDPQEACSQVADLARECTKCCWGCDKSRKMARGRLLAQGAAMSDGFVIITGGGDWPDLEVSDYRLADIFNPDANCGTGGFLPRAVLPRMESIRAGHTMTFVEANEGGFFRFLLWGGTKGGGPIAETYLESSQQANDLPGVFREVKVNNPDLVRDLYFHAVTPLTGRRFLLSGGVRYGSGGLAAPSPDDTYILTLKGTDQLSVDIEQTANGMGTGRFLHTATSHDGWRAVLVGGYDSFGGAAVSGMQFFDLQTKAFSDLGGDTSLQPRAGHRAVVLRDDTLLLVGGFGSESDLPGQSGLFEVYTPSVLGTWPSLQ